MHSIITFSQLEMAIIVELLLQVFLYSHVVEISYF